MSILVASQAQDESHYMFSSGTAGAQLTRNPNGTGKITRLAVFRAGTFADSKGESKTWTSEHLATMVENFNKLRLTTLRNVPWRANHPAPDRRDVNEVVGYYTNLSTDGQTLFADVDLTEPSAVDKFERGTYRERSIELNGYKDADGTILWPVVTGTAFVDQGAVPGLFSAANGDTKAIYYTETLDMSDTPNAAEEVEPEEAAAEPGDPTEELEAPVVPPVATPVAGESTHSAEAGDAQQFAAELATMKAEFEATKVQLAASHAYVQEQNRMARHEFTSELVANDQLLVVQRDDVNGFIDTLTGEQFSAFKGFMVETPKLSLFANHVSADQGDAAIAGAAAESQQAVDTETVKMFETSGIMTQEQIQNTDQYKRLHAEPKGNA